MLTERIKERLYRSEVREETVKALERYLKEDAKHFINTKNAEAVDVSVITKCMSTVFGRECYCVDVEIVKRNGEIVRKPFFEFEDGTYTFEELMC